MTNRAHASHASIGATAHVSRVGLRIAIPSWRAVGLPISPEPEPENLLSREEIQFLFRGDLKANARRKAALTWREEQEKSLALRLRRALYPDERRVWRH